MGEAFEAKASASLHQRQRVRPILIYPKTLRDLGAGQVDVCMVEREMGHVLIKIYEVKSFIQLSYKQRMRLIDSAKVLSAIFDLSCRVTVYSK